MTEQEMNTSQKYMQIANDFADVMRARSQTVKEIILFGSVARGDSTEASDIDMALIVNTKDNATRDIELEAGEYIMNKYGVLVGCLTYAADEWEKAKRFPFGAHLSKQGVKL